MCANLLNKITASSASNIYISISFKYDLYINCIYEYIDSSSETQTINTELNFTNKKIYYIIRNPNYNIDINNIDIWKEKHRGYAKREAIDALSLFNNPKRLRNPSETDIKKIKYYKLPRYLRAFAYFCIRYFIKLGFLDGLTGFRWHFWQGLWYRWLVDREIGRMKRSI